MSSFDHLTNVKILVMFKDVFYKVSSDLGEINSFYSSFSDVGQMEPPVFQKFKKPCRV